AIDKIAQEQIDSNIVPGIAISIVFKDKLIFAKGYGVREVGKSEKIDPDTVFQLASISKPVGATVVARAVGEKIVSWNSKISDLDPGFALSEPWVTDNLTIGDLYSHRSGLPKHAGDILEDIGYSQAEVLHRLRYQKPSSSMRAGYAYTNFGLTEAGIATAKAAKASWEKLSAEKLYKPLGMNSTSSTYAEFTGRTNKAVGHMLEGGKWVHKIQRNPDAQSPAGGVSSSVNDMSKWMRLQIARGKFEGAQIVDEKAIQEMQTPQMVSGLSPLNGMPEFYGLGINILYDKSGRLVLGHSGAFALGAGTNVKMVPSEELGICVLTNGAPVGAAEGIGNTFIDLALNGKTSQDWLKLFRQIFADPATLGETVSHYDRQPKSQLPALKSDAYVGTYDNDLYGKLIVKESGGGLSMTFGGNVTMPLKHYNRDTFTYEMLTENLSGAGAVIFTVGPDGKSTSVLVDNFNGDGQGSFGKLLGAAN
ncbi:MAG: serine hydrolase, partial [Leptolyngbya sp.]|nr:serine hydrolase [Candidatus Melainabacteria bacterium]